MLPVDPPKKKISVGNEAKTALRAMSVSHGRVRTLAGMRLLISAALAAAGAVTTLSSSSAKWVTIVGAIWAGVNAIALTRWAEAELLRAAKLQEEFEVEAFGLHWNFVAAGSKVRSVDRRSLSEMFRGKIDEDWDDMPDLPAPFDVLARQLENLGWGARVRRRYANFVAVVVSAWTVAGVVVGVVGGFTVAQIVTGWYVPSLGGLLFGLESVRQQRAVANERERVEDYAEKQILEAARRRGDTALQASLPELARQLQDSLFRTRSKAPRVPEVPFYRLPYQSDKTNCIEPTRNVADALAAPAAPPG